MAFDVGKLPTLEDAIGLPPDDILAAGDTFDREYAHEDPANDCAPGDFTGFTPTAEVLDANGDPIIGAAFAVTPVAGDTTGIWRLQLTEAQTLMVELAGIEGLSWHLTVTNGTVTKTLWCGPFLVTICGKS